MASRSRCINDPPYVDTLKGPALQGCVAMLEKIPERISSIGTSISEILRPHGSRTRYGTYAHILSPSFMGLLGGEADFSLHICRYGVVISYNRPHDTLSRDYCELTN